MSISFIQNESLCQNEILIFISSFFNDEDLKRFRLVCKRCLKASDPQFQELKKRGLQQIGKINWARIQEIRSQKEKQNERVPSPGEILERCLSLRSLDLSQTQLDDEDLTAIVLKTKDLRELVLNNCLFISDRGLKRYAAAIRYPAEFSIDVSDCPKVSAYGLLELSLQGVFFENMKAEKNKIDSARELRTIWIQSSGYYG